MTPLGIDDFPAFFRAVHDCDPFPWQERLARQVVETGCWPPLLDLPTGAGKTATIDIAVFHLACEADKGRGRKAPMRILFVIDRRIVVDEASLRARKVAGALHHAMDGVLLRVRERLAQLSGVSSHPLDAVRLRGGVPQERDWARSPAQPLVAVSTVDQVGSRLLFRGYGVSSRMQPVHAGLVGADTLWLLDEVHLSRPFAETLATIAAGHSPDGNGMFAAERRLAPFRVVHLSATSGKNADDAFRLNDADWAHETLNLRLTACKIANLVPIKDDLADAFVEHSLRLAGLVQEPATVGRKQKKKGEVDNTIGPIPSVHRLAIVVNRVNLARRIFERLRQRIEKDHVGQAELILLTGRVRPLDRDRLLQQLEPLFASPERTVPEKLTILVATQTVEAGADFDVDALVTEIAPLDALRQRFGRLDRLGLRGNSRAAILVPTSVDDWKALELIYGNAVKATDTWLKSLEGELDFGIQAFQKHQIANDLLAPRAQAPVLLPAYTDLWATTSPAPAVTPDPALFLHGPGISVDVRIIWRADVSPDDEKWANLSLSLCPLSSLEAQSVPLWAARKWLALAEDAPFADVPELAPELEQSEPGRPCLRRHGERWVLAFAEGVQPGDTLVVPCSYGGCDSYGWNPTSKQDVADLGAEAHYRQRLKAALRITKATLANALFQHPSTHEIWQRIERAVPDDEDVDLETLRSGLLEIEDLPKIWVTLLRGMGGHRTEFIRIDESDPSAGFALWTERPIAAGLLDQTNEDEEAPGEEAMTDHDDSSTIGVEVTLSDHLGHVEAKARDFASRAGLSRRMVELLALAGRLHDLGKADPRFQADLRGMTALARRHPMLAAPFATEQHLLAKSAGRIGVSRTPSAAPENFRHEALSVALAKQHPEFTKLAENERDLLLWLVGTHHGYGRRFFPPPKDSAPETEARMRLDGVELVAAADEAPLRLNQGWFERAERLHRALGPWELARLEAILRLADHAASAAEQKGFASDVPAEQLSEAGS